LRPEEYNINEIYQRQVDMVYRVCLSYMKNKADTEDCVSDTFMNLIKSQPQFNDNEHEKAWLIRAASNVCKNRLKHWSRSNVDITEHECENYSDSRDNQESRDILDAVRNLPNDCKTAVYLYYYEGYKMAEIAGILQKSESTVRNRLRKAKGLLKEALS